MTHLVVLRLLQVNNRQLATCTKLGSVCQDVLHGAAPAVLVRHASSVVQPMCDADVPHPTPPSAPAARRPALSANANKSVRLHACCCLSVSTGVKATAPSPTQQAVDDCCSKQSALASWTPGTASGRSLAPPPAPCRSPHQAAHSPSPGSCHADGRRTHTTALSA